MITYTWTYSTHRPAWTPRERWSRKKSFLKNPCTTVSSVLSPCRNSQFRVITKAALIVLVKKKKKKSLLKKKKNRFFVIVIKISTLISLEATSTSSTGWDRPWWLEHNSCSDHEQCRQIHCNDTRDRWWSIPLGRDSISVPHTTF